MWGPPTTLSLFAYGGVLGPTMRCIVRDACNTAGIRAVVDSRNEYLRQGCDLKGVHEGMRSWQLTVHFPADDALIDRSRARVTDWFLEQTRDEVLIMCDHDIEWMGADPATGYEGDLLHLARKAAETRGIVGGLVSKKTRGQGPAVMWMPGGIGWREDGQYDLGTDQLLEMFYVGAAFTAYHRSVIEAVAATTPKIPPGFRPIWLPGVVPHPIEQGQPLHLSEDWMLCDRARKLGFRTWATMRPLTRHHGTYAYEVLRDAMAPPEQPAKTKISLVHATRGRPEMATNARKLWLERASGKHEIEYIASMDEDDPTVIPGAIRNANRGNVDAYNAGAYRSTGNIIVGMHDDVEPPPNWDDEIARRLDIKKPQILHANDAAMCNPEKPWLITVAICTRLWAEKLGGLWYPEYVSVFCDDDASLKAAKDSCVVDATDLVFKHAWEGADRDETQRRSYREENWKQGQEVFGKRRAAGFPDAADMWKGAKTEEMAA